MTTPQMDEGQLRDVLARVVPDAPDTVADPAPVIRAARTRRRARVAGALGALALVTVAGLVGGRGFVDDTVPQVVEERTLSPDPYAAVPCPEVDALPKNGPLPDDVVAVRFCGVTNNGFPAAPGAPDALVVGVDSFVEAAAALPPADPARCAAVDGIVTDSRLLLELADGSRATVSAAWCNDVTVHDRTVDAVELTEVFIAALDAQRDEFSYRAEQVAPIGCDDAPTYSPVRPEREALVAAVGCADPSGDGTAVDPSRLRRLDEAWSGADPVEDPWNQSRCLLAGTEPYLLARTVRGDLVRLDESPCGFLAYATWKRDGPAYALPFVVSDLSGS